MLACGHKSLTGFVLECFYFKQLYRPVQIVQVAKGRLHAGSLVRYTCTSSKLSGKTPYNRSSNVRRWNINWSTCWSMSVHPQTDHEWVAVNRGGRSSKQIDMIKCISMHDVRCGDIDTLPIALHDQPHTLPWPHAQTLRAIIAAIQWQLPVTCYYAGASSTKQIGVFRKPCWKHWLIKEIPFQHAHNMNNLQKEEELCRWIWFPSACLCVLLHSPFSLQRWLCTLCHFPVWLMKPKAALAKRFTLRPWWGLVWWEF